MNSEDIKTIIKTATEPVVFNNLLKWQLLDWDISKWKECLGNTKLQFRLGSKKYSKVRMCCSILNIFIVFFLHQGTSMGKNL